MGNVIKLLLDIAAFLKHWWRNPGMQRTLHPDTDTENEIRSGMLGDAMISNQPQAQEVIQNIINQASQQSQHSVQELADGMRMLGQAGVQAGVTGAELNETLQALSAEQIARNVDDEIMRGVNITAQPTNTVLVPTHRNRREHPESFRFQRTGEDTPPDIMSMTVMQIREAFIESGAVTVHRFVMEMADTLENMQYEADDINTRIRSALEVRLTQRGLTVTSTAPPTYWRSNYQIPNGVEYDYDQRMRVHRFHCKECKKEVFSLTADLAETLDSYLVQNSIHVHSQKHVCGSTRIQHPQGVPTPPPKIRVVRFKTKG